MTGIIRRYKDNWDYTDQELKKQIEQAKKQNKLTHWLTRIEIENIKRGKK